MAVVSDSISESMYICPPDDVLESMGPDVIAVTKITPRFLRKNGVSTEDGISRLRSTIESVRHLDPIIAGHNVEFDRFVISNCEIECGIDHEDLLLERIPFIDTLRLVREFYENGDWAPGELRLPDFKLGTCFFGIVPEEKWPASPSDVSAHDATYDAWMVLEIIRVFIDELGMDVEELIKISSSPFVPKKMPFGKHKGLSFDDLPDDYLLWLINKSDSLDRDEGLAIAVTDQIESRGL